VYQMLKLCPKCERKRRTGERLQRINGKRYWVYFCLICKAVVALDEYTKD